MRKEYINKAIAELCGWHHIIMDDEYGPDRGLPKQIPFSEGVVFLELPDFRTDLNLIHLAERKLVKDWGHYFGMLARLSVVERGQPPYDGPVSVATQVLWLTGPDIRAEALCRIFNKWKD